MACLNTLLSLAILLGAQGIESRSLAADLPSRPPDNAPSPEFVRSCDPGPQLTEQEREELLDRLRSSVTGARILADYAREYGPFSNLLIQWDGVSYSQVVTVHDQTGRAPASASALGNGVCVHLTKKLPDIEHVADLAHELTHATRLSPAVLRGEVDTVAEFIQARLGAKGGEADAFSVECQVKRELLGAWDELCSPYAGEAFDTKQVVRDLYTGKMSASLTGETYPVMLARQFNAMAAHRAKLRAKKSAANPVAKPEPVSYAAAPYGGQ